ncbi:MAG: hypothetical protein K1T65_03790 [Candidatus Aramenus sp.]|nr:hypothetical protein [Candidatus Aramenus sp.]
MNFTYLMIIFAISVATNATPFFGTPYTIVASTILLKSGVTPLNLAEVIAVTAVGAAIAKSVMYGIGYGIGHTLKHNKNVVFFSRFINHKSFYVALFILALLPGVPLDDFAFLIGGAGKASLAKMIEITFASKFIKSSIEIPLETFGLIAIGGIINVSPFLLGVISSVVFTVLSVVIFKVDWESIYNKFKDRLGPIFKIV